MENAAIPRITHQTQTWTWLYIAPGGRMISVNGGEAGVVHSLANPNRKVPNELFHLTGRVHISLIEGVLSVIAMFQ